MDEKDDRQPKSENEIEEASVKNFLGKGQHSRILPNLEPILKFIMLL